MQEVEVHSTEMAKTAIKGIKPSYSFDIILHGSLTIVIIHD